MSTKHFYAVHMSLMHVHPACQMPMPQFPAACSCCAFMSNVHMSLLQHAIWTCFMSMLYVRAARSCQFCMSLRHFHAVSVLHAHSTLRVIMPYPVSLVLAALSWQPVWAALSWQSCPDSPVLAVLSWQSYTGSPILAVLSWQSCSANLPVHFCLFSSACLSASPVLPVLFLPVLFLPVLFCLSYSACPILPVLFCLSCSAFLVLLALYWQSYSTSPVPLVQFCPVLFCLSCPSGPVLDVLFCLSRSDCPVLPVLFCLLCSA